MKKVIIIGGCLFLLCICCLVGAFVADKYLGSQNGRNDSCFSQRQGVLRAMQSNINRRVLNTLDSPTSNSKITAPTISGESILMDDGTTIPAVGCAKPAQISNESQTAYCFGSEDVTTLGFQNNNGTWTTEPVVYVGNARSVCDQSRLIK